MKLNVQGQSDLMQDFANLLTAGEGSIEAMSNFVVRSTAMRAKNMIRAGGRSGRTYVRENPIRVVVASAPGEAPANDLGLLASSITFRLFSTSAMTAYVGSDLYYALDLELGTAQIAPRPFLFPAFREAVAAAAGRFRAEFESRL